MCSVQKMGESLGTGCSNDCFYITDAPSVQWSERRRIMSLQTCSSHRVQRETWSVLVASVVQAVWRLEGRPTGQLTCSMAVWSCCQLGARLVLRASDFVPSQCGLPHKLTCNTLVASQEWAFQVIRWLPVAAFLDQKLVSITLTIFHWSGRCRTRSVSGGLRSTS